MGRTLVVVAWLVAMVTPAFAQQDDREAQRKKQELAALEAALPTVTAQTGLDQAQLGPPPWCTGVKPEGSWSPSSIGRTISAAARDYSEWIKAAEVTCFWPNEPAVQKAAQVITQSWINMTGMSLVDAVETIHARIDGDRITADQKKLCGELVVSDEIEGEEKAFMRARRVLFGCLLSPSHPMWIDSDLRVPDELINYIDVSAVEPDELVRLALILDRSRFALNEPSSGFDRRLASYVSDQVDYHAFQPIKALQLLEEAPFKGNAFARVVVLESIGRAKLAIAAVEEAVKKKSSDADWKELLVTSPQRGIAAWTANAEKHKDVLARSNEFEHKWWGASRRALKGCWQPLRKDFISVAKTLKHGNVAEFRESLSDPIASLLFTRLAACAAYDAGDKHYAEMLLRQANDLRFARGPRVAAYYAALDTLGKINDDRPKFPIQQREFYFFKNNALYSSGFDVANKDRSGMGFVGDGGKGIVKSIKRGPKGAEIAFATEKHTEIGRSCVETNRILTFRADGSPLYYQKCHDTGPITVNDTPGAITVPAEWAEGIAVGSALEFAAAIGKPPARLAVPKAVYSDKSKKKLTNFLGLPL
ncbi:MAG TPA: hypothetical protein VGL86_14720 [Polyangia bacterium]|jgi:hypothetical protein